MNLVHNYLPSTNNYEYSTPMALTYGKDSLPSRNKIGLRAPRATNYIQRGSGHNWKSRGLIWQKTFPKLEGRQLTGGGPPFIDL